MIPIGSVKKALKKLKKHIDTKKGKFPETESLTHQKPPYVGDVGLERPGVKRRIGGRRTMGRGATRPVPLGHGGSPAQQHYLQHGYGPHKIKMAKASDKAVKGNKLTKKSFA